MAQVLKNATSQSEWDCFQKQIWILLLLQFILAIVGNGFAIYRFLAREQTWHTGIVYSFNLAISDLLYAISLLPQAAYYYPPKDWKYGSFLCKLDRFLFFSNLYGSTFFVTCISLNRYVAIVHPFFAHGRIDPRKAKFLSGAVWLLVTAISAPVLSFSTLNHVSKKNISVTECLGSASENQLGRYWPYSLFLLAFGCGLPFILTTFSCVAIVCTVTHNHNITAEEKSKVKALVSVVVVLYALFYLPFHVLRNLNLHYRTYNRVFIYNFYQIAKIVVHFHICIHPLVYAGQANSMQEYCCRGFQRPKEAGGEKVELRWWNRRHPRGLQEQC